MVVQARNSYIQTNNACPNRGWGPFVKCIYCQSETRVTNSRPQKRTNSVWRRRTCLNCGTTFTSVETVELGGNISVKSKERLEAFKRDKLFVSVFDSLRHRKTALEDATALTDTIIYKLLPFMNDATLEKHLVIRITLDCLRRFDTVAATHYVAFHPLPPDNN